MKDKQEVTTEVTTIAEQNKNGANIKVPTPEELVQNASLTFHAAINALDGLICLPKENPSHLSRKQLARVMGAILALPTEDLPIKLRTDSEKKAFALGQRAINSRFLVTQHHINLEIKKLKEKENESKNVPQDSCGLGEAE